MKNLVKYVCVFAVIIITNAACKTNKNTESVVPDKKDEISQADNEVETNPAIDVDGPLQLNIDKELYAKVEKSALLASQNKDDSLIAFIKRTPCYGRCPIYSASFYQSGYVVYRGERFIENQGIFTGNISQEKLISITKMARNVNYMGFEKEYDSAVTDFPTTYTSVKLDGVKKEVMNRVGGPDELKRFESYIDTILANIIWTKKGDLSQ